ncbi:MAG: glycerol-3-phosphate dehydrogenase/oxidase [Candidatus Electrothrix aestuarii]|uniref:Glycerol-3-phosphate dehydrogenase/oxidase n=1 Tax=Candidatus Electrothrix aestuarii TaxID=3062594 RepID=A0AAU8M176_9BACT|nr:glycerol-3-phosphate dehydrogenase/oxidase [Candidatus Electrothrix aestuarii]
MQRQKHLQRLKEEQFDILVIGGGITGACIAHDAALRGFSVALIERRDFGGFTSSASSKLLHGGIRYLPKGQVWKVRESGREQMIFQQLAPHLVSWKPFLIPTEHGLSLTKGAWALKTAMKLYDLCHLGLKNLLDNPDRKPPQGPFLGVEEALATAPQLNSIARLTGAQVLFESHMHSSERMTLAFIKTAVSNGAVVANYLEAEQYITALGRIEGVTVRDTLTGEQFAVRARLTINSAGPATQALNRSVPALHLRLQKELTGFARGVHLVTRQVHPEYALALTTPEKTEGFVTRGGRHFFIIPWRGRSLIGTTNVPFKGTFDQVKVTQKDIDDFLIDINEALPDLHLTPQDVHYAYTGLYPLIVRKIEEDKYQGTGEYQLVDHQAKDEIAGLITALGAKFTTARNMAEKTMNLAVQKVTEEKRPCRTVSTPLLEGNIADLPGFIQEKEEQYKERLSGDGVRHLIRYHGAEIDRIMEIAAGRPELLQPLSSELSTLAVEVLYAVQEEMAMSLEDVFFRRTGAGTIGRPDDTALEQAVTIMAAALGWDEQQKEEEKNKVLARYIYEDGGKE